MKAIYLSLVGCVILVFLGCGPSQKEKDEESWERKHKIAIEQTKEELKKLKLTQKNFMRINVGMLKTDVLLILGEPNETKETATNYYKCTWTEEKYGISRTIHVNFGGTPQKVLDRDHYGLSVKHKWEE